jgi:uncharacterized integral membrane protein (TIGR00698 family)
MLPRFLFIAGLLISVSPFASPPLALALGIAFGLGLTHPFARESKTYAKTLLQLSVIGLGFGMNLFEVMRAGRSGFAYTALGIAATLALGWWVGSRLQVDGNSTLLIAVGTAICGGSAIAAVAPVIRAKDEELSIALGTVFILNALALLLFPFIGTSLQLTQSQFGLWAALAIHDTSSVVGASAKVGAGALAVGTTVKLARALWIVPITLAAAYAKRQQAHIQWPWFIVCFCLAALLNTYVNDAAPLFALLVTAAKASLRVTLFLIGASISLATLRKVGARPLVLGVLLWVIVAVASLWLIKQGWIAV